MLNTLLDINQLETGVVRTQVVDLSDQRLCSSAQEPSSTTTCGRRARCWRVRALRLEGAQRSAPARADDPQPAVERGQIHAARQGAARLPAARDGKLRIEVWDTGIGIPAGQLRAIFKEYHQIDNAGTRAQPRLGLGLAIVQRLADLLGHTVNVRSREGHGSVFTIDVALAQEGRRWDVDHERKREEIKARKGLILIVEDDPEVREPSRLA